MAVSGKRWGTSREDTRHSDVTEKGMNMARLGWWMATVVLVSGGAERMRAADPAKGPDPDNKDQQLLVIKPHRTAT